MNVKQVYVACPGNLVTGGAELLHQLVDALRKNGVEAFIIYAPTNLEFRKPLAYSIYDAPLATGVNLDTTDSAIVIPETMTALAHTIKKAQICIWWLSVDNYFYTEQKQPLLKYAQHYRQIFNKSKAGFGLMRTYQHYVQSEYARLFLVRKRIPSAMLSDYLNIEHLQPVTENSLRSNTIAYNPLKGVELTDHLINHHTELKFIPIEKLDSQGVRTLLEQTKIYIDFGEHPGKDRFPREAAMAGCCIITGQHGSAKNDMDIPIPQHYKLSDAQAKDGLTFKRLVGSILADFPAHSKSFEFYKAQIRNEKIIFNQQVKNFISSSLA